MRTLSRRGFLQLAGLGALGAGASGAGIALAARRNAPPSAPEETRPIVPASAPGAVWDEQWQDEIAAAKAEGKLSLLTLAGRGHRNVIERFEQAFPGITVEWVAESSASVWLAKVRQERRGGGSPFDLALVRAYEDRALIEGRAAGMWTPIKPLLVHPDVMSDNVWHGGWNARFMDVTENLCFDWNGSILHAYAVNADVVGAGDISMPLICSTPGGAEESSRWTRASARDCFPPQASLASGERTSSGSSSSASGQPSPEKAASSWNPS